LPPLLTITHVLSTCSTSRKLSFPRHAYLVDDGHLAAYALRSGQLSTYALIPPRSATGALRTPHHLVHSPARGAWLLFCRTAAADGGLCRHMLVLGVIVGAVAC